MGLNKPTEQTDNPELYALFERARVILDAEKKQVFRRVAQIIIEKIDSEEADDRRRFFSGDSVSSCHPPLDREDADRLNSYIQMAGQYVRRNIEQNPGNSFRVKLSFLANQICDDKVLALVGLLSNSIALESGLTDEARLSKRGLAPAAELTSQLIIGKDITKREANILILESCIRTIEDLEDGGLEHHIKRLQDKISEILPSLELSEPEVILERAQVILDAERSEILKKVAQLILEKTGDGPMTATYRDIRQRPFQAGQSVWDAVITQEQAAEMNADVVEAEKCVKENIAANPEDSFCVDLFDDKGELTDGSDVLILLGYLDEEMVREKGLSPSMQLCAQLKIGEDIDEREANILILSSYILGFEDLRDDDGFKEEFLKAQTKIATLLVLLDV